MLCFPRSLHLYYIKKAPFCFEIPVIRVFFEKRAGYLPENGDIIGVA